MIFKNIKEINDKKLKASFLEKIDLYIRIVESIAELNKLDIENYIDSIDNVTISNLTELGLIESEDEIQLLKKLLSTRFNPFIKSVNFTINNKEIIGNHLDKLNNSIRLKYQKKEAESDKPTLVDFFCGAGGLSLGFVKQGFKVILANDHEDVCIDTYSYNHPEVREDKIINGDIRKIVDNVKDYINQDVDIIVGGPPCQGFSTANQQRIIDDPRNELYKYFIKAITHLSPKFVVMENVRGMLPYAQQVIDDYKNIVSVKDGIKYTYDVNCRILISDDFGVAQKRQRLIFISIRNDVAHNNNITPDAIFEQIILNSDSIKTHTLNDALEFIKSLEPNRIKNSNEIDSDISGKKVDVNQFKGNENSYLKLINNGKNIPLIYNHKSRFVSDLNYDIYRLLDQGDDATNEKIAHLMPYSHRNNVFKDKYYKLVADKPCRTITAHMRMDCHSHIHPYAVRSLTPREAARVQSFPDDYVFMGAYLKTYMQIGNAVPPIMASYIAKEIKKYL
ncbi:DNA cytosine methyltransferase [Sphingobacteriaceae bacterium WQ 2009]|uniref:Cytosine-specific methyltransferase n=1 Tax=Rhinopithecimicrobium faecis TaxID=2820698 RepID=A0A8T4HC49_9SPHI|nr:DNA cytosine methyltransferase [Sphingobacteriaceae bacterium WQ 2009]